MNFQTFLHKIIANSLLNEASGPGLAEKKDRVKSEAGDHKAKDAARKRAERARQTPREKKPKQELVKDVILVKTKNGSVQLIFKDSFNASLHQKLNKDVMTIEEAQRATKEQNFEQTRASKLLFGDVKQKEAPGKEGSKKEVEAKAREEAKPQPEEKRVKAQKAKAQKLSKQEMLKTMSQMTPEQLMGMPPELRNEYFQMTRNPPANNDFDQMSYENITVAYGLSNVSGTPYNQQVLNALVFLAKLKAGASEQEMQTYLALAPGGREFTRSAFFTARKVLSQIGDQCLQTLVTNVETGGKPVNSEGAADMECGNYKFKIAAGGEISLSSNEFNQSNKNFKGFVSKALTQALTNPQLIASNPKLSAAFEQMKAQKDNFSSVLVPDELMSQIKSDPSLLKKLQQTPIKAPDGSVVGTVIDAEGNLNPLASVGNYQQSWKDSANDLMKGGEKDNDLKKEVITNLLKTVLRGDGITDPEMAPNHLVTVNGIIPMTDDYFNEISSNSKLDVKRAKDVMTAENITKYKKSAAEKFKQFTTVVESVEKKEEKKQSLEKMLVNRDEIDPIQMMVGHIVKNNDFLLNASLLPGFTPNDLNAVRYNYVTIGKKTIKIPVMKGENITNEVLGEGIILINDLLVESLSNNFVIAHLLNNKILTDSEATLLLNSDKVLMENAEYVMINLQSIYENAVERMYEDPSLLIGLLNDIVAEEYKRNYKKEYKNYHGKPKQRKERAARTKAREELIKKGRVKRGDGKDIDHKKPLRSGGSNGINNLRVRDRSSNRSDNGHTKGEEQNKDSWK